MVHILKYHRPEFSLLFSLGLFLGLFLICGAGADTEEAAMQQRSSGEDNRRLSRSSDDNIKDGYDKVKLFDRADSNHDRQLSFTEFAGVKRLKHLEADRQRKLFEYLDQNQNGFLEMSELSFPVPKWMKVARRGFARLDQNNDNGLSFSEFSALGKFPQMNEIDPQRLFGRLDHNKNGLIERSELNVKLAGINQVKFNFMSHDKDSSGTINYAEYSLASMVSKWPESRRRKFFDRIDSNADGELNKHELWSMSSKMRRVRAPGAP